MRIHLLAVGTRMPDWVKRGYDEYARRMPRECRLHLREISPARRQAHSSVEVLRNEEARRLRQALPSSTHIVALDERGTLCDTSAVAHWLEGWLQGGCDVTLLIGGADGLDAQLRAEAAQCWSLSPLTLPHPLVRVVLAEQLYRAWTLLNNHPYHRG